MGSNPPQIFRGWRSRYRRASKKLTKALAARRYEEVANVGAKIAIVTTPSKQSFSIILASVEAYKEGKNQGWRPSPEILAEKGVREAERVTEYKLTPEQEKTVKRLIQASLEKAKKETGRMP